MIVHLYITVEGQDWQSLVCDTTPRFKTQHSEGITEVYTVLHCPHDGYELNLVLYFDVFCGY